MVTTDASSFGFGAHLEKDLAQRSWSQVEARRTSNQTELLAVQRALKAFQQRIRGRHLQVRSDNAAVVAYINKQGGPGALHCR